MKKIAIATYNSIEGYKHIDRTASEHNEVYLIQKHLDKEEGFANEKDHYSAIDDIFLSLGKVNADKVVMYIGLNGIEKAISILYNHRQEILPNTSENNKFTFVTCDCGYEIVKEKFEGLFDNIRIIKSECGGDKTLGAIVDKIIKSGEF